MEQLINQYAWLVDITLKKYLPSKMHDEDYHQIGMIALWNALKQYKSYKGTKFETYAINVIRNRLYNEMKRESRKKRSCNNIISLQKKINDSDAEEIYVEDIIADKQDSKIIDIKGYVESLSDEEKDAIYLKNKEYSNRKIAEVINISRYKVDERIKSAKEKLKDHVL